MTETYASRLALTVGGASLALTPVTANAAFTTVVPGSPLTVSLLEGTHYGPNATGLWHDQVTWDIDGVGGPEFAIIGYATGSRGTYTNGVQFDHRKMGILSINRKSFAFTNKGSVRSNTLNGTGLTFRASSRNFYASASQSVITPATADVYRKFSTGGATIQSTVINSSIHASANPTSNFTIAFSFNSGSGQQVGWAAASLNTKTWTLSINEWTYGDPSDKSIHVGTTGDAPVPEPASTLPAIALLAAGAAGVRSWRKKKRKNAVAA